MSSSGDAERLSERLRQSTLAWFDVLTIYIGQKLGFYEALHAAGPGAAGTGAVMRPDILQRYAREAGFSAVETLPVAHEGWAFYRLL
jgi:hypothetical protein